MRTGDRRPASQKAHDQVARIHRTIHGWQRAAPRGKVSSVQQRVQQPERLSTFRRADLRPPTSGSDLYRPSGLEFASRGSGVQIPSAPPSAPPKPAPMGPLDLADTPFKIICHPDVTGIRRWRVTLPAPERVPVAPSMTPRKGEQTQLTKITLLVHECEGETITDPGWQERRSRSERSKINKMRRGRVERR